MTERERIEPSKEEKIDWSKVPEGPYFVTFDDGEDMIDHKHSGLAKVDTGRSGDWPIARLCEWPTARAIASLPELIAERDQLRLALKGAQEQIKALSWAGAQTDSVAALSSEVARLKLALQESHQEVERLKQRAAVGNRRPMSITKIAARIHHVISVVKFPNWSDLAKDCANIVQEEEIDILAQQLSQQQTAIQELAAALRQTRDDLYEHHNISLYQVRIGTTDRCLFDEAGDCKICKPSKVFFTIDAALANASPWLPKEGGDAK